MKLNYSEKQETYGSHKVVPKLGTFHRTYLIDPNQYFFIFILSNILIIEVKYSNHLAIADE